MKDKYENKIVIFLDILGFKNLIDKSVDDPALIEKILTLFKKFREDLKPEKGAISVYHFSDNVAIVIDDPISHGELTLDWALIGIDFIMFEFGHLKHLIRGGISIGKICNDEYNLFGPALVDAFELEEGTPKIAFSQTFFKDYEELLIKSGVSVDIVKSKVSKLKEKSHLYNKINRCLDYFTFSHYSNVSGELSFVDYLDYLKTMKSLIDEHLVSEDPKIVEKYKWLNNQFHNELIKLNELKKKILDEGGAKNEDEAYFIEMVKASPEFNLE